MRPQTLRELPQTLEQGILRLGYTGDAMTFFRNRWRELENWLSSL